MFTMKMLTVAALLCTFMTLTRADAPAKVKAETDLVKRALQCSFGWRRINGRCFRFVSRRLSWAQAEENCQRIGGNLASVHNFREHRGIQRMTNRVVWIGGHDAEEENFWLWSNGRRFNYRYWCRGEPDNNFGWQHCLAMNYSARRCWDDDRCYRRKPSVCVRRRR